MTPTFDRTIRRKYRCSILFKPDNLPHTFDPQTMCAPRARVRAVVTLRTVGPPIRKVPSRPGDEAQWSAASAFLATSGYTALMITKIALWSIGGTGILMSRNVLLKPRS